MKLRTKYFGEMDYEESEIITFPEGLFGFEEEDQYLLIRFDDEDDTLLSLQSVKTPQLAFVVVNPFRLMPDYDPYVPDADMEFLQVNNQELVAIYAIAVVGDELAQTMVNLRAPLVINGTTRIGRQVILEDTKYSFRHTFAPKK
ncbi:MAG: flagellar assembly protein FliW [Anaerovoracaceae bacterium]